MIANETLAHEYSSESTQQQLSNEYQQGWFPKFLCLCALDGRVKDENAFNGSDMFMPVLDYTLSNFFNDISDVSTH